MEDAVDGAAFRIEPFARLSVLASASVAGRCRRGRSLRRTRNRQPPGARPPHRSRGRIPDRDPRLRAAGRAHAVGPRGRDPAASVSTLPNVVDPSRFAGTRRRGRRGAIAGPGARRCVDPAHGADCARRGRPKARDEPVDLPRQSTRPPAGWRAASRTWASARMTASRS